MRQKKLFQHDQLFFSCLEVSFSGTGGGKKGERKNKMTKRGGRLKKLRTEREEGFDEIIKTPQLLV